MSIRDFFQQLFRNKVFLISYVILMVVVAIIIGLKYGSDQPTTTTCVDQYNTVQPCPLGMGTPTIINNNISIPLKNIG